MTPNDAIERFLYILNFVVEPDGFRFEPDTPLSKIIRPGVTYPETVILSIAYGLKIEPEAVDQYQIAPETDTVRSMFERMIDPKMK